MSKIVELLKEKKQWGRELVYALKYKVDGSLERYKARLVTRKYTQTFGIHYQKTFVPVNKMNTFQILFFLSANIGWCMQQYNVKNDFLHGELD